MAKMVITSNICIFFILKLVSKIVLDYLFFIDKSKSNRRRYIEYLYGNKVASIIGYILILTK